MSNLAQSDWILAERFVDGDLPAAEAAQVESRIASDAEFAAAVEETRRQSSLFSALPNFKPPEDLRDRTLQGSLDQVKAIMGAWPMENSSGTVTPARAEKFDWKSTLALVASLAGVLVIGTMLWRGPVSEPGVAMDDSAGPSFKSSASASKETHFEPEESPPAAATMEPKFAAKAPSMPQSQSPFSKKYDDAEAPAVGAQAKKFVGKGGPIPEHSLPPIGPIIGTPMKKPSKSRSLGQDRAAATALNLSAPVEQIWCVSQDRTVSKDTVSQILNLNRIKVQREKQPKSAYSITEPVEAFYVAATPKQIMLAMSQISNNADIEMIQLPNTSNSPIADVIANQFANSDVFADKNEQKKQADMPAQFKEPASQALAQQLYSNKLPRNFVPSDSIPPTLDFPPILNSNSQIAGLDNDVFEDGEEKLPAPVEQAESEADSLAAAPNFDAKGGGGLRPRGAGEETVKEELQQRARLQTNRANQLPADDSQQLRQYLILVRGGDGAD